MIGTEIKDLRVSMGLTQAQLAKMVGVAPFSVRRWENGKVKPSPLAVDKLRILEERFADTVGAK